MRVYLIHHAHAVDAPPGASFLDDLRALTPASRRRFARTARAFAQRGEGIESLRSSPALRAVETAELLAVALKNAHVAVLEELRPGAAAVPVRAPRRDADGRRPARPVALARVHDEIREDLLHLRRIDPDGQRR